MGTDFSWCQRHYVVSFCLTNVHCYCNLVTWSPSFQCFCYCSHRGLSLCLLSWLRCCHIASIVVASVASHILPLMLSQWYSSPFKLHTYIYIWINTCSCLLIDSLFYVIVCLVIVTCVVESCHYTTKYGNHCNPRWCIIASIRLFVWHGCCGCDS